MSTAKPPRPRVTSGGPDRLEAMDAPFSGPFSDHLGWSRNEPRFDRPGRGASGRFCPTMQPLFQATRAGRTKGGNKIDGYELPADFLAQSTSVVPASSGQHGESTESYRSAEGGHVAPAFALLAACAAGPEKGGLWPSSHRVWQSSTGFICIGVPDTKMSCRNVWCHDKSDSRC